MISIAKSAHTELNCTEQSFSAHNTPNPRGSLTGLLELMIQGPPQPHPMTLIRHNRFALE